MAYPNIVPGQDLTADLLNSMIPTNIYKQSNESRTSDVTLTLDSELFMTVEANAVYKVEFFIHYSAGATGLFTTRWSVPSGSSGGKGCIGLDNSVTDAGNGVGVSRHGVHSLGTDVTYGNRSGGGECLAIEEGICTTTNSGTLGLMWAQEVSNGTATTVGGNSSMRVTRIG